MDIELDIERRDVSVSELVEGYEDDGEDGVFGLGGRLDIRPPFQRAFVYDEKQRAAVIDTINRGYPLNVMYWAEREDETFEIIDGQQRTISIAQYVNGDFSHNGLGFSNLTEDQQDRILDYKLMVYVCSGTDSEKLEWFKIINIAGEELNAQELRNAVYAGPWLADAKKRFSRTPCAAHGVAQDYMSKIAKRQQYLETAIRWAAAAEGDKSIEEHMARRHHDADAVPLWSHFDSVIKWVADRFPNKRPKLMRKVGDRWGPLHDAHKDEQFDAAADEAEMLRLLADRDVTSQAGIYSYLITGDEKHLSIRTFEDDVKQRVYEKQNGVCPVCDKTFDLKDMEADHITPWVEGGKTVEDNCQMLCKEHNRRKAAR